MTVGNDNGIGDPYQCVTRSANSNNSDVSGSPSSPSSFTKSAMFGVTQPSVESSSTRGGRSVGGQSMNTGGGGSNGRARSGSDDFHRRHGSSGGGDEDDGDDDHDYDYDDDYDYNGHYDEDDTLYEELEESSMAHRSHRFISNCKISAKAMMLEFLSSSENACGSVKTMVHHVPAGGNGDYYSTGYPSKSRHASPHGDPRSYSDGYDEGYAHGRHYEASTKIFPFLEFTSIIPKLFKVSLASMVVLYALNQSHILPKYAPKLSAWTSRVLFWPTLPITAGRRIGEWSTVIDDTVVLGGAPFGILDLPTKLQRDYGIDAVINFCQEYRGPLEQYERLDIQELYLPTVDHLEPSAIDLYDSLTFIQECQQKSKTVYVHCRAGHGRSGACTLSWLMLQDMIDKNNDRPIDESSWEEFCQKYYGADQQPKSELDKDVYNLWKLNRELGSVRKVRSSLWKQPNIWKVRHAIKRYASDYRNLPPRLENSDLDKFLRTTAGEKSSSSSSSK